ncbi:hypothetical protein [Natronomonas marina]|jgi:hypothetical protein|uniref:hypothetical protein n=1 Tax=Natronomonas marina TaxID=2961939 RepID=UPI0020C93D6A|nr:hypothetical protein [Natronomonas marina]
MFGLLSRLWPFGGDDDENTRVWDFIPAWQYDGWQSHTGGHTVDEQEKALADIQERAEAIEDEAPDHEPPDSPEEA